MPCLRAPRGYSLVYTLLPSYTLPLFRISGEEAVKLYGWRAGARLWVEGGRVCCRGCSVEELASWSGLWATIETRYGVIGLSVSPWDDDLILASVVASQNTAWWRSVEWLHRLLPLLERNAHREALAVSEEIGSYQARRAVEAHRDYLGVRLEARSLGLWGERRLLLERVKHVGVKTVHAYLLFTTHSGYPVPVDRHAARALRADWMPRREVCARNPCPRCPYRDRCPVWRLFEAYGWRAGLYQTRLWLESQPRGFLRRLLEASSA